MNARPQHDRLPRDHRDPSDDADADSSIDAIVEVEITQEVAEGMDRDPDCGEEERPKVPAMVSPEVDEDEGDEFDGIVEGDGHEDGDEDGDFFIWRQRNSGGDQSGAIAATWGHSGSNVVERRRWHLILCESMSLGSRT